MRSASPECHNCISGVLFLTALKRPTRLAAMSGHVGALIRHNAGTLAMAAIACAAKPGAITEYPVN